MTASNLKMKQTERKFIGTPSELQSSKPSPITKEVGSFAAESTPVIGEVLAAKRVIEAARKGKYGEAGIEIVGALLGTVPVVGDVASKLVRETFKKTRKAYKLFVQGKDNKLYPLFVDSRTEIPKGKFIEANFPKSAFQAPNGKLYVPSKGAKRSKGEKTKGTGEQIKVPNATTRKKLIKAGFSVSSPKKGAEHGTVLAVAARPGFHASQFPVATHIGPEDLVISKKERDLLLKSGITPEAIKSKTFFYDKDGKQVSKRARKKLSADELSKLKQTKKFYVKRRAEDHVYAEVEMPTDVDYDKMLKETGKTDINDRVPLGGSYKYQDGQADSDSWVVGGNIKVNRVLSRDEVKEIQKSSKGGLGVKDLPYREEVEAILNRKFAYGGTIGNKGMENGIDDYIIAKMAVGGEINQITEQEFTENFEALSEEEKSMVETILTQTPPEAIRALATVMGVSLQMTEEPPQEPVQEPQEPMEEPTEEITEPEQEVPQTDEMSPVERQMMALGDQPTEPVATTGPINVEGKDNSGIADDVPMEAQNNSFVVNVEALKKFGYGDFIERIIKPNLKSLEERTGIMIELAEITQPQQQVQGEVPIAISNKEIYIPKMLAEEIGYDLLEKINNRGKKQTEKKLAERKEEQPEASPQQQMQAAIGKRIKMNEGSKVQDSEIPIYDEEEESTYTPSKDDKNLSRKEYEKFSERKRKARMLPGLEKAQEVAERRQDEVEKIKYPKLPIYDEEEDKKLSTIESEASLPLFEQRIVKPLSEKKGKEVAMDAINVVSNIFEDDEEDRLTVKRLLGLTAGMETEFGSHPKTYEYTEIKDDKGRVTGTTGHGGFTQVTDKVLYNILKKTGEIQGKIDLLTKSGINFKGLKIKLDAINSEELTTPGRKEIRKFLERPVNSIAAARLAYFTNTNPLPKNNKKDIVNYYFDIFAPKTKNNKAKRRKAKGFIKNLFEENPSPLLVGEAPF